MATVSAPTPTISARARSGHLGVWRAVTAVPAMIGSLGLLLVLCAWMGAWEIPVLLAWLASGAAVLTPVGERITVRIASGFRCPSCVQAARLNPLWEATVARAGLTAGQVDLYVQRSGRLNAYAAGRRSVAVTTAVLDHHQAGHLSDENLRALLAHELGHVVTNATGFGLLSRWLAAPWRLACHGLIGAGLRAFGRQPRPLLCLVTVAAVVVAIVQDADRGQVFIAMFTAVVAAATVLCPLAEAALSRRAEFAADRYAARLGLGAPLAQALTRMHEAGGGSAPRTVTGRAYAGHPATERRIAVLSVQVFGSPRW